MSSNNVLIILIRPSLHYTSLPLIYVSLPSHLAQPIDISCRSISPRGPGSSVGIATDYGLDSPGSNLGGDEIFRPSRPALATQPPVKWVPGLSRG